MESKTLRCGCIITGGRQKGCYMDEALHLLAQSLYSWEQAIDRLRAEHAIACFQEAEASFFGEGSGKWS